MGALATAEAMSAWVESCFANMWDMETIYKILQSPKMVAKKKYERERHKYLRRLTKTRIKE